MKSIRNRTVIGLVTVVALVATVAGAGMAQRAQGGPGSGFGGQNNRAGFGFAAPAPIVKASSEGVFVLTNGMLTKYSTSMKEQATLKLVEPPKPPTEATPTQMPSRPLPGAMLVAGSKVVVVLGDQLFCVSAQTLDAPKKVSLPTMQTPPPASSDAAGSPQAAMRFTPPSPAPTLELQGQSVYVLRGNEIVAVDIETCTVKGLASLPKPAAPAAPPAGD